jgi:hypothetical protein
MGIKLLLPSLAATWHTSINKVAKNILKMNGQVVGFDAAGLLFMCAQNHLDDYMYGNCGDYNKQGHNIREAQHSTLKVHFSFCQSILVFGRGST